MPPRLLAMLAAGCLALGLSACDSVNKAFEYASQPQQPPPANASPPPPADDQDPSIPAEQRNASTAPTRRPDPLPRQPQAPLRSQIQTDSPTPSEIKPIVSVEPEYTGPSGEAGLTLGVREGYLREARPSDLQQWRMSQAPADRHESGNSEASQLINAYVVTRAYRMPPGLYGAHRAKFYVPKGVPRPTGELGHSVIYDFNTLSCAGLTCGLD